MGNPPELACDGLEAVRLFGGHTFDLALMDLRMPVMDGLTATARIRVVEHQQIKASSSSGRCWPRGAVVTVFMIGLVYLIAVMRS